MCPAVTKFPRYVPRPMCPSPCAPPNLPHLLLLSLALTLTIPYPYLYPYHPLPLLTVLAFISAFPSGIARPGPDLQILLAMGGGTHFEGHYLEWGGIRPMLLAMGAGVRRTPEISDPIETTHRRVRLLK